MVIHLAAKSFNEKSLLLHGFDPWVRTSNDVPSLGFQLVPDIRIATTHPSRTAEATIGT
jgi:hypothetical protein